MAAYFPCSQSSGFFGNFIVAHAPGANRQEIVSRTRTAIAEINSNILVNTVTSLQEQVDRSIAAQSLIARLSGFFGTLAVFLASIGAYGLLSYSVARAPVSWASVSPSEHSRSTCSGRSFVNAFFC